MKRFAFSLQQLLETKIALEEAAQRRLGDGLRCLQVSREELSRLMGLIRWEGEKIVRMNGCQTNREELMVHVRYRHALQARAHKQTQLVRKYEEAVDQLREQLRKATMARETLENLQHIEHKEWVQEHNRQEQKDMDEISIQRFMHRSIEVVVHPA